MMMMSSASCSISDSRWLETKTVRPWPAKARRNSRIHLMPSGSRPLAGSSRISTFGLPIIAAAMPRRCRMPREYPRNCRCAAGVEPDHVQHLVGAALGIAARGADHAEVVSAGPSLVRTRRLEHRAHGVKRAVQVGVPGAADSRGAAGRGDQVEHHAQRGGLAGSVGPEEAGHPPRFDGERQVVDRSDLGIHLGQAGDDQLAVHWSPPGVCQRRPRGSE